MKTSTKQVCAAVLVAAVTFLTLSPAYADAGTAITPKHGMATWGLEEWGALLFTLFLIVIFTYAFWKVSQDAKNGKPTSGSSAADALTMMSGPMAGFDPSLAATAMTAGHVERGRAAEGHAEPTDTQE
jgi:hypothetical protein